MASNRGRRAESGKQEVGSGKWGVDFPLSTKARSAVPLRRAAPIHFPLTTEARITNDLASVVCSLSRMASSSASAAPLPVLLFAWHMFASYLGKQFQGTRLVVHFQARRMHGIVRVHNSDGTVGVRPITIRNDMQIFGVQRELLLLRASPAQHFDIVVQEHLVAPSGNDALPGDYMY